MEHSLQNVRSGAVVPFDPGRTLIGTAAHAALRTAAGPYLAALATRYPDGWVLRGLADDEAVTYNREPLRLGRSVVPRQGDVLAVAGERFAVLSPRGAPPAPPPQPAPPGCRAYVRTPDGHEECRAVDHDLLVGRLPVCHVQFPDTRLSRVAAVLAAHSGGWYLHALADKPVARNRRPVESFCRVADGDELQVGPLVIRLEVDTHAPEPDPAAAATYRPPADAPPGVLSAETVDTADTHDPADATPSYDALRAAGALLDQWLKAHPAAESGRGWFGLQREKLRGFWLDVPEATAARGLRAAGRHAEAFAVLDKAVRARPEGPELLRELYRLYESVGLTELCYRPLRQIEKLADARGRADPWVLETLARVCEQLGPRRPAMYERALAYWNKLEAATGVCRARERSLVMATRALREGGFTPAGPPAADDA